MMNLFLHRNGQINMHSEAYHWVSESYDNWRENKKDLNVLEIGSLDINGSVRPIFTTHVKTYLGIDAQEGPGVDYVCDASGFHTGPIWDVIVCAEVFEHTPVWEEIVKLSYKNLVDGGLFIATMAGEGRPQHSAIDGGWTLHEGEHYANITAPELEEALKMFDSCEVNVLGTDTRCKATKGNKVANIEKEVK